MTIGSNSGKIMLRLFVGFVVLKKLHYCIVWKINEPKVNWKLVSHALRRISSDLNQSELLSIAHESSYSVLYYGAGTWLNGSLHKKFVKRLKVLSNPALQIIFRKKETGMQQYGIAQSSKYAHTWTDGLTSTWLPVTKVCALNAPNRCL